MTTTEGGLFARLRLAVPILILIGTVAALAVQAAHPLDNGDTFFHLRFGQEFLNGWSIRHPGSVSTFATREWVPTQWLPEVVMAKVEGWFGLAGVAWLSGLQFTVLAVCFYVSARRWAEPIAAAPIVAMALIACSAGLSMRPQVLSYALIAVTTSAWLGSRADGRPRWWLIPLTWVWALLHGMWPVGIILGFVTLAGLAFDRAQPRQRLLRLAAVPVGSAIAAALTPIGPSLYAAVVVVSARGKYFSEWAAPRFTQPDKAVLAVLLGLLVLALIRSATPRSWTQSLLVLTACAAAIYSARTVPVAAAMAVPLLAQALQPFLPGTLGWSSAERIALPAAVVVALAALALVVPHTAGAPSDGLSQVDAAVARIPPGTPVLDDWGWGGYFMWRFPKLDPIMHGYGDTFTTAELDRNTELDGATAGWDIALRGTGARWAVLKTNTDLAYSLVAFEQWRVVASGSSMQVLRAPPGWQTTG